MTYLRDVLTSLSHNVVVVNNWGLPLSALLNMLCYLGDQLSTSHDVTSSDDDDFWNSEAPPTLSATPTSLATITTVTSSVAPPTTIAVVVKPIITSQPAGTQAPPTTASKIIPITAQSTNLTSLATPTAGAATPSNSSSSSSLSTVSLTELSQPAASNATNQIVGQQVNVAKMESSTSAIIEEHVPLTETAAYRSLAKSQDESSLISEGSAILELEQDLLSSSAPR